MPINITISSTTGTYPGGTYQIGPLQVPSAFPSLQVNAVSFGSGTFVSTTGPVGAYGCLIEPPAGNAVALTLKGLTSDTGIPISPNLPQLLTFTTPGAPNIVGIASAAAVTAGLVTLTFF
jgi:hypothetical protein